MSVKHYVQRAGQLEESIGGWCPVYDIHGRGGLGYHQHLITGGMMRRKYPIDIDPDDDAEPILKKNEDLDDENEHYKSLSHPDRRPTKEPEELEKLEPRKEYIEPEYFDDNEIIKEAEQETEAEIKELYDLKKAKLEIDFEKNLDEDYYKLKLSENTKAKKEIPEAKFINKAMNDNVITIEQKIELSKQPSITIDDIVNLVSPRIKTLTKEQIYNYFSINPATRIDKIVGNINLIGEYEKNKLDADEKLKKHYEEAKDWIKERQKIKPLKEHNEKIENRYKAGAEKFEKSKLHKRFENYGKNYQSNYYEYDKSTNELLKDERGQKIVNTESIQDVSKENKATMNDMKNAFKKMKENSRVMGEREKMKMDEETRKFIEDEKIGYRNEIELLKEAVIRKQESLEKYEEQKQKIGKNPSALGRAQLVKILDGIKQTTAQLLVDEAEIERYTNLINETPAYTLSIPKQINFEPGEKESLKTIKLTNDIANKYKDTEFDNEINTIAVKVDEVNNTMFMDLFKIVQFGLKDIYYFTHAYLERVLYKNDYSEYITNKYLKNAISTKVDGTKLFECTPCEFNDDPPSIKESKHKFMCKITGLPESSTQKMQLSDILFKEKNFSGGSSFNIDCFVINTEDKNKSYAVECKKFNDQTDGVDLLSENRKDEELFDDFFYNFKRELREIYQKIKVYELRRTLEDKEYLRDNKEEYLRNVNDLAYYSKDIIKDGEINRDKLLLHYYSSGNYNGVPISFNKFPKFDKNALDIIRSPNSMADVEKAIGTAKATWHLHLNGERSGENAFKINQITYSGTDANHNNILQEIFNTIPVSGRRAGETYNQYDEIILVWFKHNVGYFNISEFMRKNPDIELINVFKIGADHYDASSTKINSFLVPLSYFTVVNIKDVFGSEEQFYVNLRTGGIDIKSAAGKSELEKHDKLIAARATAGATALTTAPKAKRAYTKKASILSAVMGPTATAAAAALTSAAKKLIGITSKSKP